MPVKPSGERQGRHASRCGPHPPLNTAFFPIAFSPWPRDSAPAPLHLPLSTEWKICWEITWDCCPPLAIPVLPCFGCRQRPSSVFPSTVGSDTWKFASRAVKGLMLGLVGCGPRNRFSSLHFTPPFLQGTHESLKGNAKALSTVTAIIDGTGSIGMYGWGMPSADFPPPRRGGAAGWGSRSLLPREQGIS